MAKNQSRTPGRDVRGGKGKGRPQAARPNGPRARAARRAAVPPRSRRRASRAAACDRSDLIEGRRAVEEALSCGMPLRSALVQERSGERDQALERIAARLEDAGVPVERVPRARLDALSSHGAHQGVVVRTRPFQYAELSDVIEAAGKGDALVVVLDHVTDQGNFGAIVRTAEVVGAAGVVVAKARAASVGVGAYKTSAGAVMHLPIAQVPNLARAVEELQRAGFWACAATEHARAGRLARPDGRAPGAGHGLRGRGHLAPGRREVRLRVPPPPERTRGVPQRRAGHDGALLRVAASRGTGRAAMPDARAASRELLVVDGYNVIYKSERYLARMDEAADGDPFEQARDLLVADVAAYAKGATSRWSSSTPRATSPRSGRTLSNGGRAHGLLARRRVRGHRDRAPGHRGTPCPAGRDGGDLGQHHPRHGGRYPVTRVSSDVLVADVNQLTVGTSAPTPSARPSTCVWRTASTRQRARSSGVCFAGSDPAVLLAERPSQNRILGPQF